MPTESWYSDEETMRIIRNERLLAMNKGKRTALVNAALKEYAKNHAELDVKNTPIHKVRISI